MLFRSRNLFGIALTLALPSLFAAKYSFAAPAKPIVDARPIPVDRGAAETWQLLKKLHTRASLLMIVAHPDDEDGATLAYEGRGLGVRTNLMTLNRGEGGANVMSSDLWDALGLVRTEELLQAGRYYGLDGQYFSTAADYGFSKSLKEALDKWGHDRVLSEAVRVVRTVRPLIVCSVFVGGPTDGHGNHATAGLMAQEVFKAAGDPKMFPEQIQSGLLPWSPVKEYARTPFFRTSEKGSYDYANHSWGPLGVQNHITNTWEPGPVSTTVAIPVGTYDSMLGLTYPQVSREGLGFQKSQNGGSDVPSPGEQAGNYHRFGSHIPAQDKESSFFDGIDVSLAGIANLAGATPPAFLKDGLKKISDAVESAIANFSAQEPSAIAGTLAKGLKATDTLAAEVAKSSLKAEEKYNVLHELTAKQKQFNAALLSSLGISVEADVVPPARQGGLPPEFRGAQQTFQMATPSRSFNVGVHLFNGGRPYFTRPGMDQSYYDIAHDKFLNMPLSPYPLEASVRLRFDGLTLETINVVQVISKVNGPGTLRYPMPVGPSVSLALSPSAGIVPLGQKSFPLSVRLHNNVEGQAKESVRLELPDGWISEPKFIAVNFSQLGEERAVAFTIFPTAIAEKRYQITAVADYNGRSYKEGYISVGYTGLRPYFLYIPAIYKTMGADVKMAPSQNVGYIEGSGDDVPAALEALGVHVSFLSPQDLASADLSKYDSIVVGVRAYAVRPDLIANNSRLLKYVEDGGVVMVQYNTPEYDHNFGPYPYVMTNDPEEVTDEKSIVTILDPKNPLFTWPNTITSKDFEGWIEERGSKFLSAWDAKYEPLLETHDEGQPPQKGGLVYARYGKGVYIYNAYAFYRQLPLGVPGAYRIFANMLSLPKNPQFHSGK